MQTTTKVTKTNLKNYTQHKIITLIKNKTFRTDRKRKKNISDSVKKYSKYSEKILKIMAKAKDKRIKHFRDRKKCE